MSKATYIQSAPAKTERSVCVAGFALCRVRTLQAEDMLRERIAFGEEKYGTSLHTFNGRDAFVDWLQEQLDGVQYLTQANLEDRRLTREERSVALDLLGAQLQMIGEL